MNRQQYQKFQQQIRQCQQRSAQTLKNIDSTLLSVKQTLCDISQTTGNIDKLKEEYNQVMDLLAQKIANSFQISDEPFKKRQGIIYKQLPMQVTQQDSIKEILLYQSILILTGAGVSVDSGIPTFRGLGGLYSKKFQHKGQMIQPQLFLTKRHFQSQPEGIWNWIDQIYDLCVKSKPNEVHQQIDTLAKYLSKRGIKVIIATQNIDDLHIKPCKDQYEYYNIHGNCKQLRCKNHHFTRYSRQHKYKKCQLCNQNLRPHVLFFDQSYGKNYGQEIKDKQFPLVMVIGSSVKTGLAIKMIQNANLTIQINPQPVLQIGNVHGYHKNAISVLKNLNNQLRKLQNL